MREIIKDAKYYEDYLALNTKRLARFQEQLKMLGSDNVMGRRGCAAFIACLYRSRICALYSSGSCIHDIEEIYPLFLEYLVQGVMPAEGYFDVIDAISLGVLLGAKDSLPELKLIARQTNMRNKLTDTLLHSMDDTWPIVESNDRCAWFLEFLKCAEIERGDYLKRYLSKRWYRDHRDASWYNSHKTTENIYVGYWSFEVGAVAKIYGVQDSLEWPYYPYDMVHMETIANKEDMLLIHRDGNLVTYQCPKCGKMVHELESPAVPFKKIEMCRVYVKWHGIDSFSEQICGLKALIPGITMSNQDLLNMARSDACLEIGEMSLSEGKDLQRKAKQHHLELMVEILSL